jgi:hypothetical protein
MTENERFGLVFATTGSINSGTGVLTTQRTADEVKMKKIAFGTIRITMPTMHAMRDLGDDSVFTVNTL